MAPRSVTCRGRGRTSRRDADVEQRTCTKCGQTSGLDGYYRSKTGLGGYRRDCKKCCKVRAQERQKTEAYRSYQKQWRIRNKRKTLDYADEYRQMHADKVRSDMERYRADPRNQQIARDRARAFRLANPQRRTEYQRRRRARQHAAAVGNVTLDLLAEKFSYWGDRCWICREPGKLQVDHVKPISKGGSHLLANVRPACGPCNLRKRDMWPYAEVRRRLAQISSPRPGATTRPVA